VEGRGSENRYFGYQGTVGVELSDRFNVITGADEARVGSTLGYFLKALHSLSVDVPRTTIEQEVEEYQHKFRLSRPVLQLHFPAMKMADLDHFFMHELPGVVSELGGDQGFCHGELGPWNVVITKDGNLAVIDCGDVRYYDRSKDFLARKAPLMIEATVHAYGDAPRLCEQIVVPHKAFPIVDLPYYIGKGDQQGIDRQIGEIDGTFFAAP